MSATEFALRIKSIINSSGEDISYTSISATTRNADLSITNTQSTYAITGHLRTASDNPLSGNVSQDTRELRLPALDLEFTPKKNDTFIANGESYSVESVDKRTFNNVDLEFICKARGNANS